MADVERQRRLVQSAPLDADAGGFAAQRLPSVGADRKARGQRSAVPKADRDPLVFRVDRRSFIVEPRQIGERRSTFFQCRYQ